MEILTAKKTNKSAALVGFALLILPVIAKGLAIAGMQEYAGLLRDIIQVIATIGAGGIAAGLTAKKMKGEKLFSN